MLSLRKSHAAAFGRHSLEFLVVLVELRDVMVERFRLQQRWGGYAKHPAVLATEMTDRVWRFMADIVIAIRDGVSRVGFGRHFDLQWSDAARDGFLHAVAAIQLFFCRGIRC